MEGNPSETKSPPFFIKKTDVGDKHHIISKLYGSFRFVCIDEVGFCGRNPSIGVRWSGKKWR